MEWSRIFIIIAEETCEPISCYLFPSAKTLKFCVLFTLNYSTICHSCLSLCCREGKINGFTCPF